jgi:purine-nucleoside phosphorylase
LRIKKSSPVIEKINAAVAYIQSLYPGRPQTGVILGSGLGNFTHEMLIEREIPYEDIPHFPVSTVEGHSGKLILGRIKGKPVAVMAGRFHFYEGYAADEVVFPVRVLKFLGIHQLLISNAAGGVNPDFRVGDLMIIRDHISFATVNPLIGKNDPALGPRFPDMSQPYSRMLITLAREVAMGIGESGKKDKDGGEEGQKTGSGQGASGHGLDLKEGVYFGVTGPTFETRAEYLMIHKLGADAVGMSTVQEVIIACHMGLPVFAVSVITDIGIREEENIITHEEVLEAARAAEPKLTALLTGMIERL